MTRPTREQVVEALNFVYASELRDASAEWWHLDHLAAEVGALREEVAEWKAEATKVIKPTTLLLGVDAKKTCDALQEWETEMSKLRAKLARVEALAENWRSIVADADRFQLHVSPLLYEVAAAELEAALRGDP